MRKKHILLGAVVAALGIAMLLAASTAEAAKPVSGGSSDSCSESLGTVNGYLNGAPYTYSDYCVDDDELSNYYCSGNYAQNEQVHCGYDKYTIPYCPDGTDLYVDWVDFFCNTGSCDATYTPTLYEECPYGCSGSECLPAP